MGRLREIQEEMLQLLDEAMSIVRRKSKTHRMTYERMKAYWHGSIQMALTSEHDYVGRDGATMEEAVKDIEGDGDTLEDLINYAPEDLDAEKLRQELDSDEIPAGATVADCIKYALENAGTMDADEIRDVIDKVTDGERNT